MQGKIQVEKIQRKGKNRHIDDEFLTRKKKLNRISKDKRSKLSKNLIAW